MHRILPAILVLLVASHGVLAQKYGHIDSEYILNKMPEYAQKKQELEQLARDYDKEVRSLFNEVEMMRADLRAKALLFTPEMKKEQQSEIDKKAQEALDKQTQLFGYDGLFYKKQEELLQPLRQKLFEAVEVVARKNRLDYIFDKAADVGIIYSNPVHDYTEFVLEELGLLEKQN